MKLDGKTPIHIFFILLFVLMAVSYFRQKITLSNKLASCTKYTIAKVTRIKYRKFHPWIVYEFNFNGKVFEMDDPANPQNTGEWLSTDVKSLAKRKFWVQLSCENPDFHNLLWDIAVPDTFKYIPANGWEKLPSELKPYKKE